MQFFAPVFSPSSPLHDTTGFTPETRTQQLRLDKLVWFSLVEFVLIRELRARGCNATFGGSSIRIGTVPRTIPSTIPSTALNYEAMNDTGECGATPRQTNCCENTFSK